MTGPRTLVAIDDLIDELEWLLHELHAHIKDDKREESEDGD